MADNYIPWEEVQREYGDEVKGKDKSDFFKWVSMAMPAGYSIGQMTYKSGMSPSLPANVNVRNNIKNYYDYWQKLPASAKYVGAQPTIPAYPSGAAAPQQEIGGADYNLEQAQGLGEDPTGVVISGYEADLIQQYLRKLTDEYDRLIRDGTIEKEDAAATLAEVSQYLTEGGLADPRLKDDAYRQDFLKPLIVRHKQNLVTFGQDVSVLGNEFRDDNVYLMGGVFYSDSGPRLPSDLQDFYTTKVTQHYEAVENVKDAQFKARGAEADQSKAVASYFDLQDRYNDPLAQANRRISLDGETRPGGDNDITLAENAADAAKRGFTAWIPTESWNTPNVQAVLGAEFEKNVNAAVQRLELNRSTRTGTDEKGRPITETVTYGGEGGIQGMSTLEKFALLSDSEKNVVQHLTNMAGMSEAGGEKGGTVRVKSNRSPGHRDPDTGEWKTGGWVMTSSQWLDSKHRKVQNQMASAKARAERERERKLTESYQKYVWSDNVPEGQGKKRPEGYVVKGEKTPDWLPQYVPGLEAGKDLKLGHAYAPMDLATLNAMGADEQSYMAQYTAASRNVLGADIPMPSWEEVQKRTKQERMPNIGGTRSWAPMTQRG